MTLNPLNHLDSLTNPPILTQEKKLTRDNAVEFLRALVPLTFPFKDEKGCYIQLFKLANYGMIGVIQNPEKDFSVIPKNKIRSAFDPELKGHSLMARIENISQRRWDFVFDALDRELLILPHLEGAGRFSKNLQIRHIKTGNASPVSHLTKEELVNRFEEKVKAGKFTTSGPDPANGKGAYYNKKTGVFYHIDHHNRFGEPSHIDVYRDNKHPRYKSPVEFRDKWRFAYKKDPDKNFKPDPTPGKAQFHETLQKTGLTKSFNSCHQDHPAPIKGGARGEIGGVGCSVELIEGLFDSPESLFTTEHAFFIPAFEGEDVPFNSQELKQILQELAYGIYVHDTVPFFSLHFNTNANLYPVIHPAYENTLVGQVFSMLDYFMKGYLNGGVFKETFIHEWQKKPAPISIDSSTLQQLINLKSYAEAQLSGDGQTYNSVRSLLKALEMSSLEIIKEELSGRVHEAWDDSYLKENPIFNDYTKFTNSFRIIAKQKGIYQSKGLFVLSPDFDVQYTVEPHPDYQQALEEYYKLNGCYPAAYDKLIQVYEFMKQQIHNHMVKMPFCRKYFAMLGVINFFSYYFMTLKKHRKIPFLPEVEVKAASCPTLFPPLPLLEPREEELKINLFKIFQTFVNQSETLIGRFLSHQTSTIENDRMKSDFKKILQKEIYGNASPFLQQDMLANETKYEVHIEQCTSEIDILENIKNLFDQCKQALLENSGQNYKLINEINNNPHIIIQRFFKVLPSIFKNQNKLEPIGRLTLDCFILPSEQSAKEIETGKRIVGGCGMNTSSLKVKPSWMSHQILEQMGGAFQNTKRGECLAVESHHPNEPKGMIFKLGFDNMSLDFGKNDQDFPFFIPSSSQLMRKLLQAITQDNEENFVDLIQNVALDDMQDREGRSLLHHSASARNPAFTIALLKKGLSPHVGDNKNYLPVHYAAMHGHLNQLEVLTEKYPQTINAVSNQGATPLIVAIQHKQSKTIQWLIHRGAWGDAMLNDGYTVLHCIAHQGDLKPIKIILEQSEKAVKIINAETNEGITPLMIACAGGSYSLVDYLLKKGADPKKRAKNGKTALDYALKHDNLQLCQLLTLQSSLTPFTIEMAIKKNSLEINQLLSQLPGYLDYKNAIRDTPLLMALRYAHLPVAMNILNLTTDVRDLSTKNKLKESPIELAIRGKFYPFLEVLLERGAEITPQRLFKLLLQTGYKGGSPFIDSIFKNTHFTQIELQDLLLSAAKAGNHVAISNLLIPQGVNLDTIKDTKGWKIEHYLAQSDGIYLFRKRYQQTKDPLQPLAAEGGKTLPYLAGENGSKRVFSFLLGQIKKRSLPLINHYQGRHLFYSVLERGDVDLIRLFVEKFGASHLVNQSIENGKFFLPVHLAARSISSKVLGYLYSCGAQLNVKDDQDRYPLFYAVQSKREENVAFLLDENHRNPITPDVILCAASFAEEEILDTLVKAGADLNQPSYFTGDTALLLAIKAKDMRAFLRLIDRGASYTYQNQEGWTPLLLAAKEGQAEMLEIILTRNPNAKREKRMGHNALHIACREGHEHCAEILINRGFLIDEENGAKLTSLSFANNRYAVKAKLGINPERENYQRLTEKLYVAVSKQDLASILEVLPQWPINTYFTINLKGSSLRGTLLHLILKACVYSKTKQLNRLIIALTKIREFNPHLIDCEGNSYAHLMIKNTSLDPTQFDVFPLDTTNHQGQTPLHFAAVADNIELLKNLIKKLGPTKVDPVDHQELTPLFYAIKENKREQVKALLKGGTNVEFCNASGITPLIFACLKGNYPIIRLLIKFRANVNHRASHSDKKGRSFLTPLSASLLSKNEEITLFLLFRGAQFNQMSDEGQFIGHIAATRNKIYILRFLAEQGLSISTYDDQGLQPIHAAALAGKIKAMKFLLSQGISVETPVLDTEKAQHTLKETTPLLLAAKQGTVEAVKWLLEHGANPHKRTSDGVDILQSLIVNSAGNTQRLITLFQEYLLINDLSQLLPAICLAIAKDYIDPVKILYAMGIPISSRLDHGLTGLHYACQFGALHVTEFFLKQGADWKLCDDTGQIPLELAAANSSPEQFKLMLDFINPSLEYQNSKGETLMHLATRAGNLTHVMLLIDQGADFDIQDSLGMTPLHIAAEKGFKEIVELLMICGANPKLKTSFNSCSPLELATIDVKECIDRLLLIITQAPQNNTPLHTAVLANNPLAIQLTLRHFPVNQRDALGRTALHNAVYTENLEIIRLLLNQGANVHEEDLNGVTPLIVAHKEVINPKVKQFLEKFSRNSD
ncbi:hypothetical protein DB42_BR00130 [Neochlamydia sp. EPS4]|uniref:ankyrin repeat domain-containing protein n=1 Tax=Neochlamydia sp. EPS4 TaxID=1478175 RepID=UPI000582BA2F|nr:ankyrin repeat domain-containing protein [Neochlamydia sp. EPS4]KIC73732.1 hypothetical protein DB42_BR00130 [Neochlamydia sp. EPS4]